MQHHLIEFAVCFAPTFVFEKMSTHTNANANVVYWNDSEWKYMVLI